MFLYYKKIIVNINECDLQDTSEKVHKNTVELLVYNKKGLNITADCKVMFSLSRNAMLGLGISLIRSHQKNKNCGPQHFYPIKSDEDIVQTLGLLLAPNSVESIIDFWNVPPLTSEIKIKLHKNEAGSSTNKVYEICLDKTTAEDFEKDFDNIGKFVVYDRV
jgi:hypothetical protein